MLEIKVESIKELFVLLASEFLNFEDEIFLRGVECNPWDFF
jgi:hypothetical protein